MGKKENHHDLPHRTADSGRQVRRSPGLRLQALHLQELRLLNGKAAALNSGGGAFPCYTMPRMADDPFHLQRFIAAQSDGVYEQALAELRAGRKQSHWIWFIFPQARDLGRSETAKFYGLSGVEEAAAFAAHPLLGARLRQCVAAIRPHLEAGIDAETILGDIDALKFASSMAIFSLATGQPEFAVEY